MKRIVRTGAGFNRHNSPQDYSTPSNFMEALVARFGPIHFDLAASRENTKAEAFFDAKRNSLAQDWTQLRGTLFLNPPFNDIGPWADKCAATAPFLGHDTQILFLTPASVGSEWFARSVFGKAHVFFLVGRLSFDGKAPYPKDTILSRYAPPGNPNGFVFWRWNAQKGKKTNG
jgi:phage N-6-adenine-methyltransferase